MRDRLKPKAAQEGGRKYLALCRVDCQDSDMIVNFRAAMTGPGRFSGAECGGSRLCARLERAQAARQSAAFGCAALLIFIDAATPQTRHC